MNDLFIVRKYKKEDRKSVRKIACDSAFMGEPCEIFFKGRDFLADVLTLYFTDYEPESCFVAEVDNIVAGYLIGARDSNSLKKVFFLKILPGLIFKLFFKGIIFSKKNILYFFNLFCSLVRGELSGPLINKEYPALLHINIDKKYRNMNIGTILIKNYLNYLKSKGVPGVHLNAKSEHAAVFFEKMGFIRVWEIKRTYFIYLHSKPFIYYYYAKKLAINSSYGKQSFIR
ncbi:MAG: GNAT family N-acetyltransferase [Candidatus Humimicrobiaceae bacterium]